MSLSAPLPMARILTALRDDGHIAASGIPARAAKDLEPLIAGNIVAYQTQGAGKRLIVRKPEELARYIAQYYPSGIDALLVADLASADRGTRQSLTGDTKSGGSRVYVQPVLLRGLTGDAKLINGHGETLDVQAGTLVGGCMAITLGKGWTWHSPAPLTIATTENLEVFYRVEQTVPHLDLALYASGRLSDLVIQWLGSLNGCQVIHCGDYDPVGLDEYMRLKRVLGEQVTLYMPENLEDLFQYPNHGLLEKPKQQQSLQKLRQQACPPEVERVTKLIMKYNAGLEQEQIWAIGGN